MSLSCLNMYEKLSSSGHGTSQKKKKYILWGSSLSILLVLILTLSCLMIKLGDKPNYSSPSHISIVSKFATSACGNTLYKESCESMLLSVENVHRKTPKELFDLSVQFAMAQAHSARSLARDHLIPNMLMNNKDQHGTPTSVPEMEDCMELLDDSLRRLGNVLNPKISSNSDDIRTWLSAAITNQETCLDGLQSQKISTYKNMMDSSSKNVSRLVSNSLALYNSVKTKDTRNSNLGGGSRRLLSNGFPTWVSPVERKLLETSVKDIGANVVVAKDGTGTHTTIAEALASLASGGRTVIHVKAGTYHEDLNIPSSQDNVMLVGDGKGVTVITGSKNAQDGSSLRQTATFAATGDGFIARDITFVNSAGPAKHQAIALRVSSDKSVFYRCSIVGYQDSLYTHSNRQFYKETDIYGTVDFIFGNSAVVLQSCNIIARKAGQKNYITAQGRTDPNQNTGISIHNCKITSEGNSGTYLGRPWKAYSRTVIMQSSLDSSIVPSGWYPWSGGSSPKTIYYGEYMNSGPGAGTSGRVKWPGYHPSLSSAEATKFTVANLIGGGQWLPSTGVPFDSGL